MATDLKRLEGANAFLARTTHKPESREAYMAPTRPLKHRGWAPGGMDCFAPIYVKGSDRRKADPLERIPGGVNPSFREEMRMDLQRQLATGTQREVTWPREQGMAAYRAMSMEERAEWIRNKTESPYVPPFVKVEPRRGKGL